MKLKRFLALAVSLAMVITMIPAFSVSAAGTTGVINALGGEVLWACPDGTFNDTAVATAWPGWTSSATEGNVNLRSYTPGNTLQFYTNGSTNMIATVTSPGYGGNGEDAIVIEWTMKRDNPSDLYFDFSFTDKDGAEIAFVKFDRNYTSVQGEYYMGYPVDGTDCAIVATNNGDGTHNVEYYVAGEVVSTVDGKAGTVNGFGGISSSNGRWSKAWNHIGFANLTIGAVSFSETRVDVEASYTVNGEVVHTETGHYDPAEGETGVAFPAYGYSANGTNTMYYTAGATLSENGEIALEVVDNAGTHAVGDVFAKDGVQYEIKSANLIPNGDFAYGANGWYASNGGAAGFFTANGDGTMTLTAGGTGVAGANSLYRAWAVETGKKYLITFDTDAPNEYHKVSVTDALATDDSANVFLNLGGTNNGSAVNGTNSVVFDATTAYVMVNFRWLGTGQKFGNFGLYEVVPATVTITEEIESVEAPAAITAFGSNAVVLPATVKVTGTLGSNVDGTVAWEEPATYPAGATTVNGTVTAQFGTAEPLTAPVSIQVTVVDEFTLADSESFGKQPGNVVYFPMAIGSEFTMEFDYTINEIADASVQMGNNGAIFGNAALGISPNGGVLKVTGGNKAGTSEGVTLVESVKVGDVFHMALTMDASDDTYTLVVETADGTIVTTGEKGFRTAQDTINTMTVLKNGNNADDKGTIVVSNIKVTATPVELCTVTVDGVEKQVIKGRSYKNATEGVVVIDEAGAIYVPVDGVITVPVYSDMVLTTKAIGLAMVSGAQVRVGATELAEGEKLDALADSGLRFLATADYNDTLLVDADEFGIKITAEGSSNVAYVKAETFQNDDNSVFSAAITNLAESNYNRKYTATAYVKIGNVEVTTGSVTRSIYQVSAGLMQGNGTAENGDAYTIDGVVKNILNAYVNQTGIRLSYDAETGITVEEGKYTGAVFFTVESESDGDDGFNVTITPDASWGTPAEIAQWWTDYVRFNNNNSVAKGYISNAAFADGTLTFNFDTTVD